MGLTLRPVPGKEKSKLICRAFENGAPAHAQGDVFFGTEGVMDYWLEAQARFQRGGAPFWYIDNAYTDRQRGTYFRVTKNALQVDPRVLYLDERGKTCATLRDTTGDRFAKLGVKVKPWRDDSLGKILVCPQSDSFMKSTLGRPGNWTAETLVRLRSCGFSGDRVLVRPWVRDKKLAYETLHEQLKTAALVVTWSSASAITALLEGIPAISESGSANALTGPLTCENVLNPKRPSIEERTRFAQVLADNQFTLDEFRDGTAWRWLERTDQPKE